MKRAIAAALLCLCVAYSQAQNTSQPTTKLVFKNSGFCITPLDEPTTQGSQMVLGMFLPASNRFAPNVNVMAQRYSGDLDQYILLSKKQFEEAKYTIIAEKKHGDESWTVEYSGQTGSRAMHWYAKAVRGDGTVYLTTGTALEEQWKDVADKLKACVDSFDTLGGKKGVAITPRQTSQPVR